MFVEGERTEDGYFKHWGRRLRNEVIVNVHEFNGPPLPLVERAVSEQKAERYDARHGRGQPHDEIWCVFDVNSHPKLPEAIQLAVQHGIEVAVSNPCFELWLILHYQDQTAHIGSGPAQKWAQELLKCKKVLTEAALKDLEARYEHAVKRARALDAKHEGDGSSPRSNPSSEVWKLVERIRKPADPLLG
jgi:hypothetical protein